MDFLVDLGHDNIRLAIDTYHMSIDEKDICASIKVGRDYIEYIHLSEDNRLSPGMGKIDFKRIMSTLKEIEYRGYLMFECRTAADKYAELSLGYDNIAKISQEVNYNV